MKTVPPEGDGLATFILTIVMLAICVPTVVLRFWVRIKIDGFGLDDWLMGVGMAAVVAWSGLLIMYLFSGGGYKPNDARIDGDLLSRALKYYFICQSFYCLTTIPIKLSICVALIRICATRYIVRWALWAIMGLTVVAGIGSFLGIVLSCSPIDAFWTNRGVCHPAANITAAYFISACSILGDFGLAVLPWILLWNLQLQRAIKISLAIILALAAFASTATLVRLRFLLALLKSDNFLFTSIKIALWTVVELGIGIFAGSLPHLLPLLRYLPFVHKFRNDDIQAPPQPQQTHGVRIQNTIGMGTGRSEPSVEAGPVERSLGDGDSEEHMLEQEKDRFDS